MLLARICLSTLTVLSTVNGYISLIRTVYAKQLRKHIKYYFYQKFNQFYRRTTFFGEQDACRNKKTKNIIKDLADIKITGQWIPRHFAALFRPQSTYLYKRWNRVSVSAHSAGAYTATLLVMVNVIRGGGRAPPTLTSQGQFYPHHWMYASVLCGSAHRRESTNRVAMATFWRTFHHLVNSAQPGEG
jgi:hypothetical protein